ncbi:hypothetical protein GGI42DRAFT_60133 [Trichoderma sp. SZMC 28013]
MLFRTCVMPVTVCQGACFNILLVVGSLGEVLSWPFCNLDPWRPFLRPLLFPESLTTPGQENKFSPGVRAQKTAWQFGVTFSGTRA